MNNKIIKKIDGEVEEYNREKLIKSLQRVGASVVTANEVADQIEKNLEKHTTTEDIHQTAVTILAEKNESRPAMKYSLKRSILSLGPTGFPFEKYIAKVFESKGYRTKTGLMLAGKCVEHEIDVLAYKDNQCILIEAKFHNNISYKSDTKVALYVKARIDDVRDQEWEIDGGVRKMTDGLLITNTKFTEGALKYARCAGLNLISWDYPATGSLFDLIDETNIFPITCLKSLSDHDKRELLGENIFDTGSLRELLRMNDGRFESPESVAAELARIENRG